LLRLRNVQQRSKEGLTKHKGHEFDHLKNVYDLNLSKLRNKIEEAQFKITKMNQGIRDIDLTIKKLEDKKIEKRNRIMDFQKKFKTKIDSEFLEKVNYLKGQRGNLQS
jgi:predicted  nucleic acid-binding Zn-ribbon protein